MTNNTVGNITGGSSCLLSMDSFGGRKVWEVTFIAIATIVWSIITTGGNLLVIISFIINKSLRIVTNYFIVSLATADFLIGIITINLYSLQVIMNCWPLGNIVCNIWLVVDYGGCQASVISLVLVCMDRYFTISRPVTYTIWRTKKKAKIAIILAWILAILMWIPLIYLYPLTANKSLDKGECIALFIKNSPAITLMTHILGYFLPVIIIGIQYKRMYSVIKAAEQSVVAVQFNRKNFKNTGAASCPNAALTTPQGNNNVTSSSDGSFVNTGYTQSSDGRMLNSTEKTNTYVEISNEKSAVKIIGNQEGPQATVAESGKCLSKNQNGKVIEESSGKDNVTAPDVCTLESRAENTSVREYIKKDKSIEYLVEFKNLVSKESNITKSQECKSHESKLKSLVKHKRVARMIFLVVVTYVIFWLPYELFAMVKPFCSHCIPDAWWSFSNGFAYVNSTANPFCYTLANKKFRKTFKRLLCFEGNSDQKKIRILADKVY